MTVDPDAPLPSGEINPDVFCPFASDGVCRSGCPHQRARACVLGSDDEEF